MNDRMKHARTFRKPAAGERNWLDVACDTIAWLVVVTVGATPIAMVVCWILITSVR